MATVKKKPTPKKKVAKRKAVKKKVAAKAEKGRPTAYSKGHANKARVACKLGATDEDLAEMFEVSERTIHRWKKSHPNDFCHAIKESKPLANEEVKQSLFKRATGYSHSDVHVSNYQGEITITPITKHYPPDTGACVFWLCNRDPENWKRNGDEGGGTGIEDLAEAFLKLAQVLPV